MEDIKISVIIPCYNMEIYLENCIKNIFKQTLKEIEVICVDDGSTDSTREILLNLEKQYDELKVFFQNNQGSGPARNLGIKNAKGKYIAFMDADDLYPSDDVLKTLFETAEDKGTNICGGYALSFENKNPYEYKVIEQSKHKKVSQWINNQEFSSCGCYWCYIFSSLFLRKNEINFPPYIRYQDPPFFAKAISKSEQIYYINMPTYSYRKEHKNILWDSRKIIDCISGITDSLRIALESGMVELLKNCLYGTISGKYTAIIYFGYSNNDPEIIQAVKELNILMSKCYDFLGITDGQYLLEDDELERFIENNKKLKDTVIQRCKAYKNFFIYGAGVAGRKLIEFLKDNSLVPKSVIVSDASTNPFELCGIKVVQLSSTKIGDEDFVLIAASKKLHQPILEKLNKANVKNVCAIDIVQIYLFCLLQHDGMLCW